jgi:hypothetical protein
MGTCTSKAGAFGRLRAYVNYSRPVLPNLSQLIAPFGESARAAAEVAHFPNAPSIADDSGALEAASGRTSDTQQPSTRIVRDPFGATIEGAGDVAVAAGTPLHRLAGAADSAVATGSRGGICEPPRSHGSGLPRSNAAPSVPAAAANDATSGVPSGFLPAATGVARAGEAGRSGDSSGGGRTSGSPAATMLAAMSVIRNRLAPLDGRGRFHGAGQHTAQFAGPTALAAAPLTILAGGGGAEAASSPAPGTPSLSIASDATARQQGLMWSGA